VSDEAGCLSGAVSGAVAGVVAGVVDPAPPVPAGRGTEPPTAKRPGRTPRFICDCDFGRDFELDCDFGLDFDFGIDFERDGHRDRRLADPWAGPVLSLARLERE
jgi:hypothetical protein